METRSSSKGAIPKPGNSLSGGRGRNSSLSRNSLTLEPHVIAANTGSRVVHSPTRGIPVPRTPASYPLENNNTSFNSIPSLLTLKNLNIMDNENPLNSQSNFVPGNLNSSLRPIVNANANTASAANLSSNSQFEITSGPNDRSQRFFNPNNSQTNSNTGQSLDTLVTLMKQILVSNQEEFQKGFSAIKESISNMGSIHRSDYCIQPQPNSLNLNGFANTQNLPGGISGQNLNSRINSNNSNLNHSSNIPNNLQNSEQSVKLEKWKVSYDGSSSVSDFLFKVKTLCARSRCSEEQLLSNFHVLLEDKANKWYWGFLQYNNSINRNITFEMLHQALTEEFGHLESDYDILQKISMRKQQYKESYDDFHTTIVSMNTRLQNPMPDCTLIDILKRNINFNMKLLLFSSGATTLNEFRGIARKAEMALRDNKFHISNVGQVRNVSEIEINDDRELSPEVEDPQLEAFQIQKRRSKGDYSQIQCWNCSSYGHSFIYCPEEVRKSFCFKCGHMGVKTITCPNNHVFQGNQKSGELTTGDSRPSQQTPSMI